MLNNVNYDIDITKEPPADDTARQYYFIEKAKAYVQRESEELGRPLTFCVTTFGCQMNARVSEKLCGFLHPDCNSIFYIPVRSIDGNYNYRSVGERKKPGG